MKKLFVVFILSTQFVCAQQIITDRPDQTESPIVIPKRSVQIETGATLAFLQNDTTNYQEIMMPTSLFRISLAKWIELRVVTNLMGRNVQKSFRIGMPDLEIGTKISLFNKMKGKMKIGIISHLIVPSGTKGFSGNRFGNSTKFSFSNAITPRFSISYNLGYNYYGSGVGNLSYTLSFGVSITDRLSAYIEPYGQWVDFKTPHLNMDGGFTYLLKENMQLDFSIGLGLTYKMNYISLGYSWNIRNKKK